MNNYIDVKVTVWNRLHFADESNMAGIIDIINENGLTEAIDNKLGFLETETIYDTEEQLTPEDNGNASTIEVYANREMIWEMQKK
ncbi:MAG: hypothetical protein WDO16_10890 [Bacteroidota bacterium]